MIARVVAHGKRAQQTLGLSNHEFTTFSVLVLHCFNVSICAQIQRSYFSFLEQLEKLINKIVLEYSISIFYKCMCRGGIWIHTLSIPHAMLTTYCWERWWKIIYKVQDGSVFWCPMTFAYDKESFMGEPTWLMLG